jgi:hypothetical protein
MRRSIASWTGNVPPRNGPITACDRQICGSKQSLSITCWGGIRGCLLPQKSRRTRHPGLPPRIVLHPASESVLPPSSTDATDRSVMALHLVNGSGGLVIHTVLPRPRSCRTGHVGVFQGELTQLNGHLGFSRGPNEVIYYPTEVGVGLNGNRTSLCDAISVLGEPWVETAEEGEGNGGGR